MKKILSSLALFTFIGGTAGTLSNGFTNVKTEKNLELQQKAEKTIAEKASTLLQEAFTDMGTYSANATTKNTNQDMLPLIWGNVDNFLPWIITLAGENPDMGPEIALLLSTLTIKNLSIENPNDHLVTGNNPINFSILLGGVTTSLVFTLSNINS